MGATVPYHTDTYEYSRTDRAVYHDRDECQDGERILPQHRKRGIALKPHCAKCAEIGLRSKSTTALEGESWTGRAARLKNRHGASQERFVA